MKSFELIEQRNALVADSRTWLDRAEADALPQAEIDTQWAKRMSDIDNLEVEISKLSKREAIEAKESELRQTQGRKSSAPVTAAVARQHTKAERNKALKAWLGYGLPGVRCDGDTMTRAAELGMPLHQGCIEYRSLNTATNTAGGNAVFTTTNTDLQTELKYYSPILDKVTIRTTADGNTFTLPRASDVANSVAIVAQSGASATNVDPTFDKISLGAYMFRTVVQVTYEMLQDAVFDVEGYVNQTLAIRFARAMEKYVVAGTGSSQPTGLIAAATTADAGTAAVTLAATKKNLYTFDDLMSLFYAVDLAYRPNCTLVLHDSSVWDLRKIKDSQGRYIWDINNTLVQNQQPNNIAGFNYVVSNSIDASGSFSKNLAVFADLSRHNVRVVEGVQITRLNELYRANGIIGFEAVMRFDSNYVGHASSIARLATPAS
jgi:HK97 family phage major capsid protein